MKIQDFNHQIEIRVRTFDIDMQGIVHNSVYLKYLEIGRIEYRRSYGYKILKSGQFNDGLTVIVAHNSIDYNSPAHIDDVLIVKTKISWIKNSSFCFEQIIVNDKDTVICDGMGILVNLNPETKMPEPLPEKFIHEVQRYENNLELKK